MSVSQRVALPTASLILFCGLYAYTGVWLSDVIDGWFAGLGHFAPDVFASIAWLSAGLIASRLINALFWDIGVAKATGALAPRLAKQLTSFVVFLLTVTGIVGFVFELPVSGILTTSGAVGLLLGFAARNLILDLFSGISINLERPFDVGEYVQVHIRGLSNIFGRVEETNWRTTRILTPEGSIQVIPNSALGTSVVTNYSRPTPISEFELTIAIDPAVDPTRAQRVIDAGLRQSVAVGGPLKTPDPKVRIAGIDAQGIRYKIKYFIDPRKGGPGKVRHIVLENVLSHLFKAGLRPAFPKSEVLHTPPGEGLVHGKLDGEEFFATVGLLSSLRAEDRARLMETVRTLTVAPNTTLTVAGQTSGALFLVVEGWFEARVPAAELPEDPTVDQFGPGDFFGADTLSVEGRSMATVASVSQGVVFEIPNADLEALLDEHPAMRERVSTVLDERRALYERKLAEHAASLQTAAVHHHHRMLDDLVGQVRAFFHSGFLGRIGQGFHGLTATRRREAFADALMAACALVSTADGTVDAEERQHVRNVFDSVGLLSHISEEEGMARFEANIATLTSGDPKAIEAMLDHVAAVAGQGEAARIILSICRTLASADGFADADEAMRIGMIAERLNMAEANTGHFDERMFD